MVTVERHAAPTPRACNTVITLQGHRGATRRRQTAVRNTVIKAVTGDLRCTGTAQGTTRETSAEGRTVEA